MPRRSSILQIPEALRAALNGRLVSGGFADYEQLTEWLNERLEAEGMELRISKSALHRHGQQFEDKLEKLRLATEQAKAITAGVQDDEGAMNEAIIRLVQQESFDVLMSLGDMEDKADAARILPKMGLMISRIVSASVGQKKWMREVQEQLESRKAAAAEKIAALTAKSGLTAEVAAQIRAQILGIDVDGR